MKDLLPEYLMEAASYVAKTAKTLIGPSYGATGFFTPYQISEPEDEQRILEQAEMNPEDEDEVLMFIGR